MWESRTHTPRRGTHELDAESLPSERLLDFPVSLTPNAKTRVREGIIAFLLAPPALAALLLATNSLLAWAAVGQPLSSPEGAVGVAISAFLLLRIGLGTTRTCTGLAVTAGWALVIGSFYAVSLTGTRSQMAQSGVSASTVSSPIAQLLLPLSWSALPLLFLAVTLGALLAARLSRFNRARKQSARAMAYQSRISGITAFLAILLIWAAILEAAPPDISEVAAYGPVALGLSTTNPGPVFLCGAALFVLAASAGWSAFSTMGLTVLLLSAPALLIFPVSSSLGGTVAAPGAPVATSVALASPVVGTVSVLVVCLTWALHWVQSTPLTESGERP